MGQANKRGAWAPLGNKNRGGLTGQLLFLDLGQRLAVNAQLGGGTGFQTTDADLDAAMFAVTEIIPFEFDQRLLDLLDSLRSRSRARSSRANSSSCAARSTGSGKLAASSFI